MKRGTVIIIIFVILIAAPVTIAAVAGPLYPIKAQTSKDKPGLVKGISRYSKKGEAPK